MKVKAETITQSRWPIVAFPKASSAILSSATTVMLYAKFISSSFKHGVHTGSHTTSSNSQGLAIPKLQTRGISPRGKTGRRCYMGHDQRQNRAFHSGLSLRHLPLDDRRYSCVGGSQGISVTLGFSHANVVRLQENEMELSMLKRSGGFRCLSSPFIIMPFFENCQRAVQTSAVIRYGTYHWGYPPDPFELRIQTS